jgi:hypothetical protein
MIVKALCQNCNGSIEFDDAGFSPELTVECPHCKVETVLSILAPKPEPKSTATSPKKDEQVDFETFKRVLFAKDSAYRSFGAAELGKMYDNKHPMSLVTNQQSIEEVLSKSKSQSSGLDSPPIVKFFYFLMVANFIAAAAGIVMANSDNSENNAQLGTYLAIAGIGGGISCIIGAVFFKMLSELIYHSQKIHEILKKKSQ